MLNIFTKKTQYQLPSPSPIAPPSALIHILIQIIQSIIAALKMSAHRLVLRRQYPTDANATPLTTTLSQRHPTYDYNNATSPPTTLLHR